MSKVYVLSCKREEDFIIMDVDLLCSHDKKKLEHITNMFRWFIEEKFTAYPFEENEFFSHYLKGNEEEFKKALVFGCNLSPELAENISYTLMDCRIDRNMFDISEYECI